MTQITKNTIFSELLITHSFLIPVVNRFGIRLGVGDKSVATVCKENNINVYFFITILRIYLDEELCHEEDLCLFDVSDIVEYIKTATDHFSQTLIPNIEKHFMPLIAMSDSDNEELRVINKIFGQFKSEFSRYTRQGLEQKDEFSCDLLLKIKSILVKHISGNYNQNLAYAVIFSIDSLEKELTKQNLIFDLLLSPKLKELDPDNLENLSHMLSEEHKHNGIDNFLTNREIEILKLIVQGYMNKEIAEKLNISLNTVLSHRKNIISKTGIKTISGLTFYAIFNGYVSSGSFRV